MKSWEIELAFKEFYNDSNCLWVSACKQIGKLCHSLFLSRSTSPALECVGKCSNMPFQHGSREERIEIERFSWII